MYKKIIGLALAVGMFSVAVPAFAEDTPPSPNYVVIFGGVTSALHDQGIETNIDTCAGTPTACSNLSFEKTGFGKISFVGPLNLTDTNTVTTLQSLGTGGMQFADGEITFDATAGDVFKTLGGQLEMYGLAFPDSVPPVIFVDGVAATGDDVSGVSYVGGTLTFTAKHFSTFSTKKVVNTTTGEGYDTIQAAVTAASTETPETISVGADDYAENVTISTPLTLQGTSGANLTGSITIASDSVTVDGMDITNPSGNFGIVAIDHSNLTITNNTIHDIGMALTSGSAQAIYVKSGSAAVTDITISDNHISNVGNTSLVYNSSGSAKGIFIGDSSGSQNFETVIISGNDITNVAASGIAWVRNEANTAWVSKDGRGAYGILVNHDNHVGDSYGMTNGLSITDNTISNLDGLWAHGIGLEGNTPNATVSGNTITGLTDHKSPHDAFAVFFEDNASMTTVSVDGHTLGDTASVAVDASWAGFGENPVVSLNSTSYIYGVNAFSTIQDGIDAVDSDGTVNVAAGTYQEQVIIGHPLTLIGAGDTTIIKSPASLVGTFSNGSNTLKPVVSDIGSDFTVKNLKIDGDGQGNANNFFVGLGIENASSTMDHVAITGVRENPLSGSQHGDALYIYNQDGTSRTATVTNSTFTDFQKNAMVLKGAGLSVDVSGNTVTGVGPTDRIAQNGIQVSDGATGVISGNTVDGFECNHSSCGSDWYHKSQASGILLVDAIGPVTVSGNSVSDNDIGIYSQLTSGTTTISDNVLSNNRYFGVLLESGNADVSGGSITGSGQGVLNPSEHTSGTFLVNGVNLSGNTVALQNDAADYSLDATRNYWGSATGPVIDTDIMGDGGAEVDFDPWYTNAGMTTLSDGEATDAVYTSTTEGEADLPEDVTEVELTDDTVLDLSDGLVNDAVTLNSGTPDEDIVLTNADLDTVTVNIPDGTLIQGPKGWDGIIEPPTEGTPAGGNAPAGFSVGSVVISVGSPDGTLVFDEAVTILLEGVTGTVGYRPSGSDTWQTISSCAGTYDVPTLPIAPGECSINNGTDTKIVTYHFTSFGGMDPIPAPAAAVSSSGNGAPVGSLGGGGGVGGSFIPGLAVAGTGAGIGTGTGVGSGAGSTSGEVLGAAAYNFGQNLALGSRGADVDALQQILIDGGFLNITAPTGYFGALTRTAVMAFQAKYGIAQVGLVGPQTRAQLNKGSTGGSHSNLTPAQKESILDVLRSFGADASIINNVNAAL